MGGGLLNVEKSADFLNFFCEIFEKTFEFFVVEIFEKFVS